MSALGLMELGITPRQALMLEFIQGFADCFASMSHIAAKIGVKQRQGFYLQAQLRAKGLLGSQQAGDRNATPPDAKHPAKLRHNGWAKRSVTGVAAIWFEQRKQKIEAWRQKRDEKRAEHRQAMADRREKQKAREATANPPPPSPPHNRPFRNEAPTGPAMPPPAAAYQAIGRTKPPD